MAKSVRTLFQLGALVLLLIVFPAASWYYLNSGLQYRRSAMAELQDHGPFPLSGWVLSDGTALAPEFLEKKMLVVNVLPATAAGELQAQYGQTLKQLHDQFKERDELVFLTIIHGDSTAVVDRSAEFKESYALFDTQQQLFAGVSEQVFPTLQKELLQPAATSESAEAPWFLLTDATATIRRYYDVRKTQDIKRMVEHIALLLPLKKDRELIFKREVEK